MLNRLYRQKSILKHKVSLETKSFLKLTIAYSPENCQNKNKIQIKNKSYAFKNYQLQKAKYVNFEIVRNFSKDIKSDESEDKQITSDQVNENIPQSSEKVPEEVIVEQLKSSEESPVSLSQPKSQEQQSSQPKRSNQAYIKYGKYGDEESHKYNSRASFGPGTIMQTFRAEDSARICGSTLELQKEVEQIQKAQISELKRKLKREIQEEKKNYLGFLDQQESLIKNDANRKIFSMIPEELHQIQKKEKEYLDHQIISKSKIFVPTEGDQQEQKSQVEVNHDQKIQRREIYVQYCNLKPIYQLRKLEKLVPRFEDFDTLKKNQIFQSLKVGHSKQRALAYLYKEEIRDEQRHQKIQICKANMLKYEKLLRQILPKEFQDEYLTLKDIAEKRENINRIFTEAEKTVESKLNKIDRSQLLLKRDHQDFLGGFEAAKKEYYDSIAPGIEGRKVLPFSVFRKKYFQVKAIQQLVDAVKVSTITDKDREGAHQNELIQMDAEYDAQQIRNVLYMLSRVEGELSGKIKKLQHAMNHKQSELNKGGLESKEEIQFDGDQLVYNNPEHTLLQSHMEFIKLLRKYEVDPVWLKNYQLKELREKTQQEYQKIYEQAIAIEQGLYKEEHSKIVKLIEAKTSSVQIKKYLVNRLKAISFANGIDAQNNIFNSLVISQLESNIKRKKFDSTDFIAQTKIQQNNNQVQIEKPSVSVFDELNPDTRRYKPANSSDMSPDLSGTEQMFEGIPNYQTYKFEKLEGPGEDSQFTSDYEAESESDIESWYGKDYEKHPDYKIRGSSNGEIMDGNGQKGHGQLLNSAVREYNKEFEQHKLLREMTTVKRDAWLKIYNDFRNKQGHKSEQVASVSTDGMSVVELGKHQQLGKSVGQEDFFDMFKHWEYQALLTPGQYHYLDQILPFLQEYDRAERRASNEGTKVFEQIVKPDLSKILEDFDRFLSDTAADLQYYNEKNIYVPGLDVRQDLVEESRNEILYAKTAVEQYEQDLLTMAGVEQFEDDPQIFDSAFMKERKHTAEELKKAEQAFYEGFGENARAELFSLDFQERFGIEAQIIPSLVEHLKALSDSQAFADRQQSKEVDLYDADFPIESPVETNMQEKLRQRMNLQFIDDILIKKIEKHLKDSSNSALTISDDYVFVEKDVKEALQKRTGIYYDIQGYEKLQKEQAFKNLSPFEQQEQILTQVKEKQRQITQALEENDRQAIEVYENDREDQKRKKQQAIEEVRLIENKLEDTESQLEREVLLKQRDNAKKNLNNLVQKDKLHAKDPIARVLNTIDREAYLRYEHQKKNGIQEPLREYYYTDPFNTQKALAGQKESRSSSFLEEKLDLEGQQSIQQQISQEEQRMMELAASFKEFDLRYIVQQRVDKDLRYTGSAEAADARDRSTQAQSALQITNAAKYQVLSSLEQRLSRLYDPYNPVREMYLRQKFQMFVNKNLREKLAQAILNAQKVLDDVKYEKKRLEVSSENKLKSYTADIIPQKVYDFLNAEQDSTLEEIATQSLKNKQYFDSNSKEVEAFNNELKYLIQKFKYNQQMKADSHNLKELRHQSEYLAEQMLKNQVKPNATTHSLVFSKYLIMQDLEMATISLKNICDNQSFQAPPVITKGELAQFFEQCVSKDNFNGLAHLASYLERYQIDISQWKIQKFRPAIDFYINHTFDINKILTFTRFYVHFAECRLKQKEVQDYLTNDQGYDEKSNCIAYKQVFGTLETLVDMNALFQHLVEKIGLKTFIDPITKKDPLQQLIKFFTRKSITRLNVSCSEGTTYLNSSDIVKYIMNHIEGVNSFQTIEDLIIQLEMKQNLGISNFPKEFIQSLKVYIATKKQLPSSFSQQNIRNLYLKLKAKNSSESQLQISENTAEFMLYLFKCKNMTAESIDLCDNYHKIVKGYETAQQSHKSEIRNYYMSASLLDVPIADKNQYYYQLLEKAVFSQHSNKASPAYLTSMTKAYLLDRNIDFALKFFEQGIQTRRQQKSDQEEFLVKLFDSTIGLDTENSKNNLNYDSFKQKYLQLMLVKEKLMKEAKTVHLLDQLLQRCDPEEIDSIFMLQLVLKEETSILRQITQFNNLDYDHIYTLYNQIENLENIELLFELLEGKHNTKKFSELLKQSEASIDQQDGVYHEIQRIKTTREAALGLQIARQRRNALEQVIQNHNKTTLMKLIKTSGDSQVIFLGEAQGLEDALKKIGFSLQDYESFANFERDAVFNRQVIDMLKTEHDLEDESVQEKINKVVLEGFKRTVENISQDALKSRDEQFQDIENSGAEAPVDLAADFQDIYGVNIMRNLSFINRRRGKIQKTSNQLAHIQDFKTWLYDTAPNDEAEELVIRNKAFSDLAVTESDTLINTVTSRRQKSLPFAIEIFNKNQGKKAPQWFKNVGQELNVKKNPSQGKFFDQIMEERDHPKVKLPLKSADQKLISKDSQLSDLLKPFMVDQGQALRIPDIDSKGSINNFWAVVENSHSLKDSNQINQTIERYDYLLNNKQSPIISNFTSLLEYNDGRDMPTYQEFFDKHDMQLKDQEAESYSLPIQKYFLQAEKLEKLTKACYKMIGGMKSTSEEIQKRLEESQEEALQANKYFEQWTEKKQQQVKQLIEEQIQNIYNKFLTEQGLNTESAKSGLELAQSEQNLLTTDISQILYVKPMTKAQKVQIMRQALSSRQGTDQIIEVFNSFYSIDLILFGIENNIPEAVRLGEKMLGDQGESLSFQMAKVVKNYQMNNNYEYQKAIRNTGPIDTLSVYMNNRPQGEKKDKYSRNSIINMDDPYWQEYFEKNYRTQDSYKVPSAMAWEHKEHGILSDIIDYKKLNRNLQEFNQIYQKQF